MGEESPVRGIDDTVHEIGPYQFDNDALRVLDTGEFFRRNRSHDNLRRSGLIGTDNLFRRIGSDDERIAEFVVGQICQMSAAFNGQHDGRRFVPVEMISSIRRCIQQVRCTCHLVFI